MSVSVGALSAGAQVHGGRSPPAVVETAIKANAAMAADALATIQLGSDKDRLVFEGLQVSARIEGAPFEPYLVGPRDARAAQALCLCPGGARILAGEDWDKALAEMVTKAAAGAANAEGEEDDFDQNDDPKSFVETHIDDDAFDAFRNRARSFRCQICLLTERSPVPVSWWDRAR